MTTTTAAPAGAQEIRTARAVQRESERPDGMVIAAALVALVVSAVCLAAGTLALIWNQADAAGVPLLVLLALSLATLAVTLYRTGNLRRDVVGLASVSAVLAVLLLFLPEYTYGHEVNGIVHRSMFSAVFLIGVGLPAVCTSLFYAQGATPSAWDRSRYPIILFPVGLVLAIYAAVLVRLAADAIPELSWNLVTTPYSQTLGDGVFITRTGLWNHLLGTLLLVAMTAAIALPIGVGAGAYMSEYGGGVGLAMRYATMVLRAISVFILAVTAFTLADWSANYPPGDLRSDLLRGFYFDSAGAKLPGHGSYVTAAVVLSLLVIPVIARSTEEGFRSVPTEIREGSYALGASEGHRFLSLLLPWAMPNIITGLLLGCAEAAGSVAVLLFIAGTGEFGVGPLRDVTSLSFAVYYADRGTKTFVDAMGDAQMAAAFLLIVITFGLSIAALLLKARFARRYRGT